MSRAEDNGLRRVRGEVTGVATTVPVSPSPLEGMAASYSPLSILQSVSTGGHHGSSSSLVHQRSVLT